MIERRARVARIALAASLLACGAALGYVCAQGANLLTWLRPAAQGEMLANTASVVVAVRDLARLESVSFHMERVIDLKEQQAHLFGLIRADEAILLVAAGDVVAGIDLAKLSDGDVEIEPAARRARLRLPAPEILSARLDNRRTYVHSRTTELLARRNAELETRARQHAEESIRSAALEAGILERARDNAAHTLEALLRSLGYDHVELDFQEPP